MVNPLIIKCKFCDKAKKVYKSRLRTGRGKFCSKECTYKSFVGRKQSPETVEKRIAHQIGRKIPYKSKPSIARENNHNWKGGVTPLRTRIWRSQKYREWRESIFIQDSYTCKLCGVKNGQGRTIRLEADHHPIPFVKFIETIRNMTKEVNEQFRLAIEDVNLWAQIVEKDDHEM